MSSKEKNSNIDRVNEEKKDIKTPFTKMTKKQLFWEIVRFVIVGGIATLCDYITYYICRRFIFSPSIIDSNFWNIFSIIISTTGGFLIGLIVNWFLSIFFVFKNVENEKKTRSKKSFFIFTLIALLGFMITLIGMNLGVLLIPDIKIGDRYSFLGLAWKEWIMKIIMTGLVLVWNYIARKIFIFR